MLFKYLLSSDKTRWHFEQAFDVYLFKTSITKIKSVTNIKKKEQWGGTEGLWVGGESKLLD